MLGVVAGSFFNPPVPGVTAALTVTQGNWEAVFWGPPSATLLLEL